MALQNEIVKPLKIICRRMRTAPLLDGSIREREWSQATRIDGLAKRDGSPAAKKTSVWLGYDNAYFYFAARCEEPDTLALQRHSTPYIRHLTEREHLQLFLDTEHAHAGYRRFYLGPYDLTDNGRGTYRVSFRDGPGSRWHHTSEEIVGGMYFRYASSIEEGKGWSCEMAIPYESIDATVPQDGSVWGLNLMRIARWPFYDGESSRGFPYPTSSRQEEGSWLSPCDEDSAVNPLHYADLLFSEDAVTLVEADFGLPHFGDNMARLRFSGVSGNNTVLTYSVNPKRWGPKVDAGQLTVEADARGEASIALPWKARFHDDTLILRLNLEDKNTKKSLWSGAYDFGWETGNFPLYYLHEGETVPIPDPSPADPDFLARKAEHINSRQPRFFRKHTRNGAPSDFTLQSSDGKITFNLMEPDCFDKMASYLRDLYDNDTDRLLGVLMFMAQPALMRAHSSYDPAASGRMETLSLLRYGSGYCGHMSRVMCVIINKMRDADGRKIFHAVSAGIGGHALGMVKWRDSYVILDSKHPVLYYRLDNSDLATLAELRREPEIARRCYPYFLPALMTFREEYLDVSKPENDFDGSGQILPQGAEPPVNS